jgi:hypothetical protein
MSGKSSMNPFRESYLQCTTENTQKLIPYIGQEDTLANACLGVPGMPNGTTGKAIAGAV